MEIRLYQINLDRDENNRAFMGSDRLDRSSEGSPVIDESIYDCVFSGELDCETPEDVFANIGSQFDAGFCDDAQTKQTIARLFEENKYLSDTHTAVAVKVYEDYRARTGDTTPTVIASTASPFKFCQSVISALGGEVTSDGTELLDQLHDMTGAPVPAPLAALSGLKPRFDLVIDREDILGTVDLLNKI